MYVMVKFSLTFPLQDLPPFLIHALIFFYLKNLTTVNKLRFLWAQQFSRWLNIKCCREKKLYILSQLDFIKQITIYKTSTWLPLQQSPTASTSPSDLSWSSPPATWPRWPCLRRLASSKRREPSQPGLEPIQRICSDPLILFHMRITSYFYPAKGLHNQVS